MTRKKTIPTDFPAVVTEIGDAVTPEAIDVYGKYQEIKDKSHHIRTIIKTWKDQQEQERMMRGRYAFWLMVAMSTQILVANVAFFLIGLGLLTIEEWTARTFIVSVFAEVASLVLFVVKYLFTPTGDSLLRLIEHLSRKN
jgi:hypothetical protein